MSKFSARVSMPGQLKNTSTGLSAVTDVHPEDHHDEVHHDEVHHDEVHHTEEHHDEAVNQKAVDFFLSSVGLGSNP